MKTCEKCGAMNGDRNDKCYKCGASLADAMGKICRKCGEKYSSRADTCSQCGGPLSVYDPVYSLPTSNTSYVETWMYVVAFLIPIVGLVLGCIKVGQGDSDGGKKLIITAIVSVVLYVILTWYLLSRNTAEIEKTVSDIQDTTKSYGYRYY